MRRAAVFAMVALFFLATFIVLLGWLLGAVFGGHAFAGIFPAILALLLIWGAVRIVRGVGSAATPLGDLVEASARVEAGQAGTQVDVRGPREIQALARAFNSMSARLAADAEQRRRLLADVSHELRTPLTVIQGGIEGMLDGLYAADRPQLERILVETRQLERLIEDLRTLSLSDAGALPLRLETTDLGALAAEVVDGFAAAARAEGVNLSAQADGDVPLLQLDPHRVRQVIANLVSNAVRHTPAGGRVSVRVRREADAVTLEVADTGSGMDAEASAQAFDRFWRAGERAGAGLGLAIVRQLVRAHGGDAELESAPGRGTTVRCRFPLERRVRS
ncbi:MAG TPA: HAMP domain-containing sensor histidine kinase [Candidatus Limnocylindria bacterium]|nr:HAMP domain-containing sensor histidine kinase [Candidatus Limnocylindria bacterium]